MKERPILFSAPMVRAILDGRKTQTRRVVKSPAKNMQREGMEVIKRREPGDPWYKDHVWSMRNRMGVWGDYTDQEFKALCPYGQSGDRLWVRETWRCSSSGRHYTTQKTHIYVSWQEQEQSRGRERGRQHRDKWYLNDNESEKLTASAYGKRSPHAWRPSIHMPRWASRITLEVTGIRVERLQSISEEDALAEGVDPRGPVGNLRSVIEMGAARYQYANLWENINGAKSWDANPWVWVVEFRRMMP